MSIKGQASLEWYCDEIAHATSKKQLQDVRGSLMSLYHQGEISQRIYNGLNHDIRRKIQRVGA